jgi:hypothetical protein
MGSFGKIRVGGMTYGIGGNLRSNISLLSSMLRASVDDPAALGKGDLSQLKTINPIREEFSPFDFKDGTGPFYLNADHPTIKWLRTKSSPSVSMAWDILSGEDYIGIQYDDPLSYHKLSYRLLPFAIQAQLTADIGIKERPGMFITEFLGLNANPISKYQKYKEQAERDLGDTWEELDGTEYLKQAREDEEHFPELAHAYQKSVDDSRAKGNEYQTLTDYVDKRLVERDKELLELAKTIDWTKPGGGEAYLNQSKYIKAQYLDDYKQKAADLEIDMDREASEGNRDKMLGSELDAVLFENFTKNDGSPDYDAYEAARENIIGKMSTREQQAVREKKYYNLNDKSLADIERRRDKAGDLWGPYLDAPKYKGLSKAEGEDLDKLMDSLGELISMKQLTNPKWKGSKRSILRRLLQNPNIPAALQKKLAVALLLTYDNLKPLVKDSTQRDMIMNNPDFAVFYPNVYGDLSDEDQEKWDEKYGNRSGVQINYAFLDDKKD